MTALGFAEKLGYRRGRSGGMLWLEAEEPPYL
jgi:hypothetical protein